MNNTQPVPTQGNADAAIEVRGVTKDYPVYASPRDRLLSLLKPSGDRASRTFSRS